MPAYRMNGRLQINIKIQTFLLTFLSQFLLSESNFRLQARKTRQNASQRINICLSANYADIE